MDEFLLTHKKPLHFLTDYMLSHNVQLSIIIQTQVIELYIVRKITCIDMVIIVNVIILANILIYMYQITIAVEPRIGTSTSLIHKMNRYSNDESNASSQHSQSVCLYSYGNTFKCRQGELLPKVGYCATCNDHTKLASINECPFFQTNGYNCGNLDVFCSQVKKKITNKQV